MVEFLGTDFLDKGTPMEEPARRLREPSQLPDISGDEIIIHWDFDGSNILLCHGQQVLWKEPSYFECYDRYLEVGQILLKKYGSRLKDFVPTEASKYHLFGDTTRACLEVDYFRENLRR